MQTQTRARRESGARFRFQSGQTEEQRRVRYRLLLERAKGLHFAAPQPAQSAVQTRRQSFSRGAFRVFHVERKHCAGKPRAEGDARGLKALTRSLLRLFHAHAAEEFTLDSICVTLGVDKRKIYDLVNILAALSLIRKVSKGFYRWHSLRAFVECVEAIPRFDALPPATKAEKSLGAMSVCFLALLKGAQSVALEAAAEQLSRFNDISHKSKVRRLYDICKILAALGLVSPHAEEKRATLSWLGTAHLERDIAAALSGEGAEPARERPNARLAQLKTELFNNISRAIEASDLYRCPDEQILRKRRTSSFDVSIVERFLGANQQVVLPKVNIRAMEKPQ